ncbi:MAG TPA: hypothetical protein VM737_01270, partial [Gemmatimonadota bacterium]|nr:hypothetical protein [Gemmatimonadota bacterium]
ARAHPLSGIQQTCAQIQISVIFIVMEHRISSTDLARRLGDILGRIRYLGDSFVIERSGEAVALLTPLPSGSAATVREGLRAWAEAGGPDASFADALERVGAADRVPGDPWVS